MISKITKTDNAIVQESGTLVRKAFITAPIPIIGAKQAILKIITVDICTICTSFVERVIRDAVENFSSSAAEKAVTRRNNALLTSLDVFAATLAENSPASPVSYTHLDVYKRQLDSSLYTDK